MRAASLAPWTALAVLAGAASACTVAPPPAVVAPQPPPSAVDHLEERALLLLLADRGIYEPFTVSRAFEAGPDVRRELALTLARAGALDGGPTLERLLGDPEAAVRRAAAFALGELGEEGYAAGRSALLGAAVETDREVGRLAVEALAKLRVGLDEVAARLATLPVEELYARLLPSLFRFRQTGSPEEAVRRWGELGLEQGDPGLRALAAYGLAREPSAAAAPALRGLLADPDPWLRGWAARALGQVGDRNDVARLRPLLDDAAGSPVLQALRAVRRLVADGKVAAPADWRPRLLELLVDPRPGVRLTAIEVSAAWLLDEEVSRALVAATGSPVRRERELALVALAEGQDPQAPALVAAFARDSDPELRERAADAAALLGAVPIVERLAADPVPGVRVAALDALLGAEPVDAVDWAQAALGDPDPAVRATGLGWAVANPRLPMELLLAASSPAWRDREDDARLAGIDALRARAQAEPRERGAIVERLEALASDPDALVRRRVGAALVALDRPPPDPGGFEARRTVQVYREIVLRTRAPRFVDFETEKGTLRIQVDCPAAPLTCVNFLQLAGQGFYDGLTFHRVLPDFVVQTGDPRGDGWGGPGYSLRDEVNPLRFDGRGVVGMALSGSDTGGSQVFVSLSAQPHLDGGYTVFGRVVGGEEVLETIVQGDRILRAVVVEEAVPAP